MIYVCTQQILPESDRYEIISPQTALHLLKPLRKVGLDTETRGFDPYTKELIMLQLGCYEFQVVIDITTVSIEFFREFLESDRLFIGWNIKFDLKFLLHQRVVLKNVYDGFLAEKLMWMGYPAGIHSMALKAAGQNYLGVELDKTIRGKVMWAGLSEDVIEYGANDVKYLERIMNEQMKELQKKDLVEALKYENKFVIPLAYMEYCGVKLDVEKWQVKMKKDEQLLNESIKELNNWVITNLPNSKYLKVDTQGDLFTGFDLTPKVLINWNSSKQLIPLFKSLGIEVATKDKATGDNKDSIDAKVLKPQTTKCSLIPIYLKYRERQKVVSTYGDNFLKQINPVSHRIHTNYNQLGTDTGRLSSGGKDRSNNLEYVNMQNLPSDAETRACFVAEKGNKWISVDYSGQETYLMASIANDKAILEELIHGSGDMHSLVAKMVFKDQIGDTPVKEIKHKFHDLRQLAKGYEFLFNYGGDANTIVQNYGKSIEEATAIYNNYMNGFKGLKQYQAYRRKEVMDKGYILLNALSRHKAYIYDYDELMSIKKRFTPEFWSYYKEMKKSAPDCETVQQVRKFFKRKSASEKQSINYPIQATGALCFKVAVCFFYYYLLEHNLLYKVKICVGVHDEINCEAPEEIAEDVAQALVDCMVKAGSYFCTRCKLGADISRLEDRKLPTYWVH